MPITDIHHVAIKTMDLEKTDWFYLDVLGIQRAFRPDFGFPGSWYQMGATMIHVYAGDTAVDDKGRFEPGSAAIDHISVSASDFEGMKRRLIEAGVEWRQLDNAPAKLWQLFAKDPSGIVVEMNFPVAQEPPEARGPDGSNVYVPGRF